VPVTLDVVKHKRRFATFGEVIDSRFETHAIKQAAKVRILSSRFPLGGAVLRGLAQRSQTVFLLLKAPKNEICGDTIEPGRERRLTSKGMDLAEDMHEYVLGNIFCFHGISEHAPANAVNQRTMVLIDDFECSHVVLGEQLSLATTR
jgi:hypothetical protein